MRVLNGAVRVDPIIVRRTGQSRKEAKLGWASSSAGTFGSFASKESVI